MGARIVNMLAPDCDLDDMYHIQRLLRVINKLNIPKNTKSFLHRTVGNQSMHTKPKRITLYSHQTKEIK